VYYLIGYVTCLHLHSDFPSIFTLLKTKKEPPTEAQNNSAPSYFQLSYFEKGFHQYADGKSSGLGQEVGGTCGAFITGGIGM